MRIQSLRYSFFGGHAATKPMVTTMRPLLTSIISVLAERIVIIDASCGLPPSEHPRQESPRPTSKPFRHLHLQQRRDFATRIPQG